MYPRASCAKGSETERPFLKELTSTQMWASWISTELGFRAERRRCRDWRSCSAGRRLLSGEDSKDIVLFDEVIVGGLNNGISCRDLPHLARGTKTEPENVHVQQDSRSLSSNPWVKLGLLVALAVHFFLREATPFLSLDFSEKGSLAGAVSRQCVPLVATKATTVKFVFRTLQEEVSASKTNNAEM